MCEFLIFRAWEPFSETGHFCLWVWATRQYQNVENTGIIARSQPPSCPKLRNSYQRLLRYGSGRTHTRPTTRFPNCDQYHWWIVTNTCTHNDQMSVFKTAQNVPLCNIKNTLYKSLNTYLLPQANRLVGGWGEIVVGVRLGPGLFAPTPRCGGGGRGAGRGVVGGLACLRHAAREGCRLQWIEL